MCVWYKWKWKMTTNYKIVWIKCNWFSRQSFSCCWAAPYQNAIKLVWVSLFICEIDVKWCFTHEMRLLLKLTNIFNTLMHRNSISISIQMPIILLNRLLIAFIYNAIRPRTQRYVAVDVPTLWTSFLSIWICYRIVYKVIDFRYSDI